VEAAIVPALLSYGAAFAVAGLFVGGAVSGWGSLAVVVAALATVAGIMNATFAAAPHAMLAGVVAFIGVFVVVGAFAVISHLIKRHFGRGKLALRARLARRSILR